MSRKDKLQRQSMSTAVQPAVKPAVKVDRSKYAAGACGACKWCDVRDTGYCGNRKTVDALDGWDRIIVNAGKFGCVNWEKL